MTVRLLPLLLLTATTMWAAPEGNLHISISLQALQKLDALASHKIEGMEDAAAYVRESVALCVYGDSIPLREDFESRLAAAELEAAKDSSTLVSDDRVAAAFNFMSDEFGVENAVRLSASDILEYRSVEAAIFPHVFSPKSVKGSRPIGAAVMLYMLWYNGGITEGVRNAGKLDRAPGTLKISGTGRLRIAGNSDVAGRTYRLVSQTYFAHRSPQEVGSFLRRLAGIIALPEGR